MWFRPSQSIQFLKPFIDLKRDVAFVLHQWLSYKHQPELIQHKTSNAHCILCFSIDQLSQWNRCKQRNIRNGILMIFCSPSMARAFIKAVAQWGLTTLSCRVSMFDITTAKAVTSQTWRSRLATWHQWRSVRVLWLRPRLLTIQVFYSVFHLLSIAMMKYYTNILLYLLNKKIIGTAYYNTPHN